MQLDRFGNLRLTHLKKNRLGLLRRLEEEGMLEKHLLSVQRRACWEMDQLVMAGLEEVAAEEIVIRDIIQG